MHPIVKEFLEFRKKQKKSPYKTNPKKSFCGSPKNKGSRRMGTQYECLKRGYGSSTNSFIKDLDKFFKAKDRRRSRSR